MSITVRLTLRETLFDVKERLLNEEEENSDLLRILSQSRDEQSLYLQRFR